MDIFCEEKTGLCLYCYAQLLRVQAPRSEKLLEKIRRQMRSFVN
jgi:hypothetical protein